MTFEELVQKLSPKLKAIAKKLDGRYTSFDDDDLYQEALCSLWEKYSKGELADKTDSFVLQGCFFFLKNHIRKVYKAIDAKSTSLQALIDEEGHTLEEILPLEHSHQDYLAVEEKILLETIYAQLSERERKILELSIDDITTRQIGQSIGISHAMVIKIKNKIKDKCKTIKKEIL